MGFSSEAKINKCSPREGTRKELITVRIHSTAPLICPTVLVRQAQIWRYYSKSVALRVRVWIHFWVDTPGFNLADLHCGGWGPGWGFEEKLESFLLKTCGDFFITCVRDECALRAVFVFTSMLCVFVLYELCDYVLMSCCLVAFCFACVWWIGQIFKKPTKENGVQ